MMEGRGAIVERADHNWQIVQRPDFSLLLAGAILDSGIKWLRLHDFGDFFSVEYIKQIASVARMCSTVQFWCYTRAWRRAEYRDALAELAALPNFSLLLSADRATGWPPAIPNTEVAWLAPHDGDAPFQKAHVVFRASKERTPDMYRMPLQVLSGSVVCPIENGMHHAVYITVDDEGRERKKKIGPQSCVECGLCIHKQLRTCGTNDFGTETQCQ